MGGSHTSRGMQVMCSRSGRGGLGGGRRGWGEGGDGGGVWRIPFLDSTCRAGSGVQLWPGL